VLHRGTVKIAVIGTGYVGLVAGACFADSGTHVTCVDVDEAKLEKLRKGEVPFFEPNLAELVKRNWPHRLEFTSNLPEAIDGREVVFIAVGTPPQEDGSADLSHVLKVAEQVSKAAKHELSLVTKSTVPVGTNARVREVVEKFAKHKINVVSNPEFLKEGDAVNDFLKPDRIVVGTEDDKAFEALSRLYAPFNRQRNRLLRMSPKSAEIVKYAANAMLATKISFMNEIARLCDVAGGDAEHVRVAVGSDERIGMQFLYPGLGFGGSCFPKDLRALVHTGEELGVDLAVARAAVAANEGPVNHLLTHMEKDLGGFGDKVIAIWGLAFKPRTDDVREAPALRLIKEIVKRGGRVQATDPEALETSRERLVAGGLMDKVTLVKDEYAACKGADALVLATEWSEYRAPDLPRIKAALRGKHLFDGRNAWVPQAIADAGLVYRGMGRPQIQPK
jgi:UDPglucose 6-dehydrogenase